MREFERWLVARTELIVTARRMKQKGLGIMPLEIKGLKGKALAAGGMFDRLNKAYDKLIETGDAHAVDVESLPDQIDGMQDDLQFMVQTLGNSVGASANGGTKPPDKPKTESKVTAESPEVAKEPTTTFQG